MVFLHLHAPAQVMVRVESLSSVLAWATFDEHAEMVSPATVTQDDLRIVSLPRLKLTFQAREVKGSVRSPAGVANVSLPLSAILCPPRAPLIAT